MTIFRFALTYTLLLFLLSLYGCSDGEQDTTQLAQSESPTDIFTTLPVEDTYIELGDLDAIKKQAQLRILITPISERWLPRNGNSFNKEQELAIRLAQQLKLEPVFIHVENFEDLIPSLISGRGDIIAANLTITQKRKKQIDFSLPFLHGKEYIVSRNTEHISKLSHLQNRTIAYKAESSYESTYQKLFNKEASIKKQILSGNLTADEIIDMLVIKEIDLTILDRNILDVLDQYRDDFKVGTAVTDDQAIALATRKNTPELLREINVFISNEELTNRQFTLHSDDLDGIKKRKTLRVITRNNAASYFLWRGELLGFEYEMVKAYAKENKLRLEIISAPTHESQIPMLLEGKGDVIASFMSITEKRKKQDISFSRAHHKTSEIIVSRSDDSSINSIADLSGRRIHVRKSSAYWETLNALQKDGLNFKLIPAPENMETEEIISRVANGEYDLTLADNHLLNIELTWREDIKGTIAIGEERKNAWLVRKNNPKLLDSINRFLKKQHRSLFYNVTYDKYFINPRFIKKYRADRIDLNQDGTLSPYDTFIKKYANKYKFDWRLIVSQMYQESRFNPNAKSWAGAQGLMQVMPRTAKELGIKNLKDPELGIHAGVRYLNWVRDRFEPELTVKDRMWFTLAAYNAGHGHVKDARRLAKQQGLNPNKWFDNVEKAMLLLSKRKYSKKARYGYVRGTEPVNYVRNIRSRYRAYLRLAKNADN